jgi:hypothetical protein
MILASAGDTSDSLGSPARSQSRSNKLLLDFTILGSVTLSPYRRQRPVFAKIVIDRLGNKVADAAVLVGANPLDEHEPVREQVDGRADQVRAGGLLPLFACVPRIDDNTLRFGKIDGLSIGVGARPQATLCAPARGSDPMWAYKDAPYNAQHTTKTASMTGTTIGGTNQDAMAHLARSVESAHLIVDSLKAMHDIPQ